MSAGWELIDGRAPADSPEDFPKIAIESEVHLRAELERLKHGEPVIVALEGPIERGLQIGIGGPYAGVRWAEHPVSKRMATALPDRIYSEERIDFAAEGDFLAFWPQELMPVERAVEIILHFYKTHQVPGWVAWKEWDPTRHQWVITPAVAARSA